MIQIAEILGNSRNILWDQVKQIGVDHAVTGLAPSEANENGWDYMPMLRMRNAFNDAGLEKNVYNLLPFFLCHSHK